MKKSPSPDKMIQEKQAGFSQRMFALEKLANRLDSKWQVPGTNITFGWDSLIGLIPGVGDTLTFLISGYIFREGCLLGVPGWVKWLMIQNIFLDWLIGLIPIIGDWFDVGWKANLRNVKLIRKHAKY